MQYIETQTDYWSFMLSGGRNSLTISFSIKSTTRKLTRGIGDEGFTANSNVLLAISIRYFIIVIMTHRWIAYEDLLRV